MADEERIWRATDAEQIATEEIIPRYHTDLSDARVLFLFTDKERKSQGKVVWAKTTKLSGTTKYLSSGADDDIDCGYDFMVLISGQIWDGLSDTQRRALVDHELSHMVGTVTDDGYKYTYRGHDIEEFSDVFSRWKAWNHEVRAFVDVVASQLALPV